MEIGCNLQLWDWRQGEVKLQLYQKSFSRDSWPSLQLSRSEDLVLHQVNNAVNVYETQNASAGEFLGKGSGTSPTVTIAFWKLKMYYSLEERRDWSKRAGKEGFTSCVYVLGLLKQRASSTFSVSKQKLRSLSVLLLGGWNP